MKLNKGQIEMVQNEIDVKYQFPIVVAMQAATVLFDRHFNNLIFLMRILCDLGLDLLRIRPRVNYIVPQSSLKNRTFLYII